MGDEAFRQLSAFDPNGNELLDKVLSVFIIIIIIGYSTLERFTWHVVYLMSVLYSYIFLF